MAQQGKAAHKQPAAEKLPAAELERVAEMLSHLLDVMKEAAQLQPGSGADPAANLPTPEMLLWLRVVESLTLSSERLARARKHLGAAGSEADYQQINQEEIARRLAAVARERKNPGRNANRP